MVRFSHDVEGNQEKITKGSEAVLPITGDGACCLAVAGLPPTEHEGSPEVWGAGPEGHQKCPSGDGGQQQCRKLLFLCFASALKQKR